MATFEEFKKLDIRMGKILEAERVEGSDKLLKLKVNLGDEERQIVAGIGRQYEPGELLGKEIAVVVNLEPRTFMGLESRGMLLAADDGGRPALLMPDKDVPPGSVVK